MYRSYAEYSAQPTPYEVRRVGNEARVTLRENILQLDGGEGDAERWGATEYSVTMPWRAGIEQDIAQNVAQWLARFIDAAVQEAAVKVRAERDRLLAASDQRVALDRLGLDVPSGSTFTAWIGFFRGLGEALTGGWAQYRQALRDLPEQEGFPFAVIFPTPPAE